jgi:hypothetical protein
MRTEQSPIQGPETLVPAGSDYSPDRSIEFSQFDPRKPLISSRSGTRCSAIFASPSASVIGMVFLSVRVAARV